MLYLKKANDDLVSHCQCEDALVSSPTQADCPWCGCGWLWTCLKCRQAFTFAVAVEIEDTLEQLAHEYLGGDNFHSVDAEELPEWLENMTDWLSGIQLGQTYVYFDGLIVPATAPSIDIEGIHTNHHLGYVPQVKALTDPSELKTTLSSYDYWSNKA